MDKKNTMLLTVIAVATLLVAVVGATFAYFTVSGNSANTTTVTGTVGGDHIGSITLTGGTPLYLAVSANDMAETKKGNDYFTVTTAGGRADTAESKAESVYTAKLVDNEDSTAKYSCDYVFTVAASGTMSEASTPSRKDVELVVTNNGVESRYTLANLPGTIEGTWDGITGNGTERTLKAYMVLHNTTDEAGQNDLAGTELSLTIAATSFTCYPEA